MRTTPTFYLVRRFVWALLPLLLTLGACNSKTDAQKDLEKQIEEHKATDDTTIQEYLQKNNITNYRRTDSGLYISPAPTTSTLPSPIAGAQVKVRYIGRFISDGYRFDASIDNGTTCGCAVFTVGSGIIEGWNEAMKLMHKGDHVMIYVPSHLAYGYAGTAGIPAYTPLMFDIELVDFTNP